MSSTVDLMTQGSPTGRMNEKKSVEVCCM